MDSTVKGCASAASHLGYPDVAALILEESMGPERIAVLFKLSASEQAWRHAALIILAGGISRYRAEPLGWSGEVEQRLAREALPGNIRKLSISSISWPSSVRKRLGSSKAALSGSRFAPLRKPACASSARASGLALGLYETNLTARSTHWSSFDRVSH